jgi:hypothetical protein
MRHPLNLSKMVLKGSQIVIKSHKIKVPSWQGEPLDFLARLSPYIPSHYERLERYLFLESSSTDHSHQKRNNVRRFTNKYR